MSADDPKRRRSRRPKDPPREEAPPAGGGAFFRAPTRTFQALPTEVLDVEAHLPPGARGQGAPAKDPRTGSRLPASLFEPPASDEPGDFAAPPPTEALETSEVRRLAQRHAAVAGYDPDALELTNPDPFRVELDSDERALLEVAREETHHDLFLQDLAGPPSETSTDVEAPKPVSGLHALGASSTDGGFEDNTVALDNVSAPHGQRHDRSPFLEATDEDAALPSEPPSLELPAPAPPPLPSDEDQHAQDRYYSELREVIGAARVFDPKRPLHDVTDPGFREQSDEWPEITLDRAPLPAIAARRPFPFALVAFLVSALVVTVGGVGIGFSLSKRGVSLDDLLGASASDEQPTRTGSAPGDGASTGPDDDEASADEGVAADAQAIDPSGVWRERTVRIYFANIDDASRSGARDLAGTLLKAFTSALASDEHARWGVVPDKPEAGYGFALSLAVLSIDKTEDGSSRARCALNGKRQHEPAGDVRLSVSASRRAEGSLADADDETLAREAARACGFALALEFFAHALR